MTIDNKLIDSYPFTVHPLSVEDGGGFAIEYPDLPGCISDGSTPEEALINGRDAVKSYLLSCVRYADPIPAPSQLAGSWLQRSHPSEPTRLVTK